ncbi:TPA: hypothetical protein ACXZT8_000291 [Salmonella enterica]|nr:hypothetical protein [Salmonella enterica]EAW6540317.1 hypothetical protein [Salmonella enterica]ELW7418163.1 hypothetical protein [Salmonella enterica]HCH9885965.1 hypothetical protein [Salmonella enterica]
MRKYTAYRQGEERFDGQLYRMIALAEQKARENPRVNAPPSSPVPEVQEPKPEAPPAICPARQVMSIYREHQAEQARAELEKARRMLARKAEIAAKYLNNKNG